MKIKKKVWIPALAVLVVGGLGANAVRTANAAPAAPQVDTYIVEHGDLINSISVTGTVGSSNAVNVYTTLSYPVSDILVKKGATVKEGDLLCTLDTSSLETTIAKTEASIGSAQARANHTIALAEKELKTYEFNVDQDYNSQLLQAQATVDSAEASVRDAENALRTAQHNAAVARRNLREARDDIMDYDGEQYVSYDDMERDYQKEVVSTEISRESAEQKLEDAQHNLEAAKASYEAIKNHVSQEADSTKDAITTARLNANFNDQYIELEQLRKDLANAEIKAPVSGTVTDIIASEGASSSTNGGLLFIIEDTDKLKVKTKVKEYDIGKVEEGMEVAIRSDSTGEEEFTGELTHIAPTTLKDEKGETVDTTSAEFEAEVEVKGKTALRIGVKARMDIITEKKENVISVPLESVVTQEDGTQAVFILEEQEDGTLIAKKMTVTTGMETDFACELTSSELKDGDEVITDPTGLEDGMHVTRFNMDEMMGMPGGAGGTVTVMA